MQGTGEMALLRNETRDAPDKEIEDAAVGPTPARVLPRRTADERRLGPVRIPVVTTTSGRR